MAKKDIKEKLLLILFGITTFFVFKNLTFLWAGLCKVINAMMPFFYGLIIAYLVNWPYEKIKKNIFDKCNESKQRLNKVLSMVLAYVLTFGIIIFLIVTVIPQLVLSFNHLAENFSQYRALFEENFKRVLDYFNFDEDWLYNTIKGMFFARNENATIKVLDITVNFLKNFTLIMYNWIIGIVVSIYFLFNKEKLFLQINKLSYVSLPKKVYDALSYTMKLTGNLFGKFIIGKIIDGMIIGVLCFIGTSLLNIPYSVLISVIVGITNVIPFFGPFLGAVPCIFMLLIIDPWKAICFAIFILILQQIDGNIIGPKILGSSIGISGMFIMFSVIIGGGIWGIPGMVFGVPVFAVIYAIISKLVNEKFNKVKSLEE